MLFITTTLLLSQLYVSVGGIPAWTHLFHCEFGPITFTKPHHFWGACRKPGNREVMNTDWLRWAFGLKSVSTPQISIHWRHYLKSRSDLKIFSRERPFQILKSMVDLLLLNRLPFQSEDLYVLLPCHLMDVGEVCTSSALYIISKECTTSKKDRQHNHQKKKDKRTTIYKTYA